MTHRSESEDRRRRLLVNADDLGASSRVNDAVFALMSERRIRSATLLANGLALDDAISRIGEHPDCSFGAHLNVATGLPVGSALSAAPLLDPAGQFCLSAVRKLFLPAPVRAAVLDEWRSQIVRLKTAGVDVSHLDSHYHTHTIPALFGALKQLQREFGIRRVRMAGYPRRRTRFTAFPVAIVRRAWNASLRCDGTRTADQFCNLSEFAAREGAQRQRRRTIEIMVHPGRRAGAEETRLLDSEWWTEQLATCRLISYREL